MAQTAGQAPEGGKAQRVYLLLCDEILRGEPPAGAALPGELRLAEQHGVSRVTIRRALDALAADGLMIVRRPGARTTVTGPGPVQTGIAADFATLMPQLVRMEQSTTARLLSFGYGAAPAAVAAALGPGHLGPEGRGSGRCGCGWWARRRSRT